MSCCNAIGCRDSASVLCNVTSSFTSSSITPLSHLRLPLPNKISQNACLSLLTKLLSLSTMAAKLSSVVVAVDASEESMNALRWALENLHLGSPRQDSESGSLVILHVQSPPNIAAGLNPGAIPFGGPSNVEVPAFTAAIEAHQKRITETIVDHALQICAEKNVAVKTHVVVGDPKEMICDVTEKLKTDLLVMGCRNYGAIKRMFLGSVSNYCINHVQCPVMVVKGSS